MRSEMPHSRETFLLAQPVLNGASNLQHVAPVAEGPDLRLQHSTIGLSVHLAC